jgi:hypothetical protein
MSMHNLLFAALLATTTPATPPPDGPDPVLEAAGKAYWQSLQSTLRGSASPRDRALSAFAGATWEDPASTGKILREAAQSAPSDALVQMMWTTVGPKWGGCDQAAPCPEQSLAWAHAEPDNGFAWLPAFDEIARRGDDKAIDGEIGNMAAARYYDDHFVDFWLAYRKAILAHPMPPLVLAAMVKGAGKPANAAAAPGLASSVAAMGPAAALPLPMQMLTRACNHSLHPEAAPPRFENCARIGRAIIASDSSANSKMIATVVVRVTGLETEKDRRARIALEWRQNRLFNADSAAAGYAEYFADLASTGSEIRAQELAIARRGDPIDPPLDWKGSSR